MTIVQKTYVIAEIGVNHNGSMSMARDLVDAAVRTGANAVKFQHFDVASLVTAEAPTASYQKRNDGSAKQQEMLLKLSLTDEEMSALALYCEEAGIDFLCTPFDLRTASFVAELGVKAIKIGSGDLTYDRMLSHVAGFGLPLILSTGMATIGEVAHAISVIEKIDVADHASQSFPRLTLLHCTSSYPTTPSDVNLAAMRTLATTFSVPVGYSDHTQSIEVSAFAVAAGASVIEKHLTLDRTLEGPDHAASLTEQQFKSMVQGIRAVEEILGNSEKQPTLSEQDVLLAARRSLHCSRDLAKGHAITEDDVVALRPGTGIEPSMEATIVGKKLGQNLARHTMFRMEHFFE